jgi:TPR repeat protein
MDDRRISTACALIMCCALFRSAVADCPGSTVLTAGAAQASTADSLNGRQSRRVLLNDSEAVASFQQKSNHGDVDAMNQLGIMYARGRGVIKDYGIALKWFRESALQGYPPAMVNLGTMYQFGMGGHHNYRRAYAWIRVALAFGVPEPDHDTTIFKLGMIASQMGPTNATRAERLARDIAAKIAKQCQMPSDRYTDWAFQGSNP